MTSTPSMDLAGSISLPSGDVATPFIADSKGHGNGRTCNVSVQDSVFLPLRFMLTASMEVTKDLPTPPLPLTTPITFFTELAGFSASRNSLLSALRLSQFALQEPQSWLHSLIFFRSPSNISKPNFHYKSISQDCPLFSGCRHSPAVTLRCHHFPPRPADA